MGILDSIKGMVLGLKDIEVNGNMHIDKLCKQFKEQFGTELVVYKSLNTGRGAKRADMKVTLASVCPKRVEGITIKKSDTVGEVEDQFKESMGIGVQIMEPDGEAFAPNSMMLRNVANIKK